MQYKRVEVSQEQSEFACVSSNWKNQWGLLAHSRLGDYRMNGRAGVGRTCDLAENDEELSRPFDAIETVLYCRRRVPDTGAAPDSVGSDVLAMSLTELECRSGG